MLFNNDNTAEKTLIEDIQQLIAASQAFDFLNNEEDIYIEADIKKPYNKQG